MIDRVPLPELKLVLERFPRQALLVRQLFMADHSFRSACEDYRLACDGLAKFGTTSSAPPSGEVEEYRTLVGELEAEITAMFRRVDGGAGLRGRQPEQGT